MITGPMLCEQAGLDGPFAAALRTTTPSCATVDSRPFFAEYTGESPADAKRICSRCPLLDLCREWAIENSEVGIWGGTTERERKVARRRRAREAAA